MQNLSKEEIRQTVNEHYSKIAEKENGCCGENCCTVDGTCSTSEANGYSTEELASLPEGADLGLGCGNPTGIASIKPGETVLDLGSGAGIDCFIASKHTGESGKVIGIDMSSSMLLKARGNKAKGNYSNVDFRLGEIENLPVADNSIDIVISNCVINLSTEKHKVFGEIYRVLKKGGRIAVSDIVSLKPLSEDIKSDPDLYKGCMAGASSVSEVETMLKDAGFNQIEVTHSIGDEDFAKKSENKDFVFSATIKAVK